MSPRSTLAALLSVASGCGAGGVVEVPRPDLVRLEPTLRSRVESALAELEATPSDAQAWLALGMTYEANGLEELALGCYDEALARDESPRTWSRVGQASVRAGRTEAAAAAFRRSITLKGDYAPTHWRLGSVLYDLGDLEGARAAYQRATQLDPDHTGGWVGLARVELQSGRAADAVRKLEALLETHPDDADALRLLRTAYLQAGRSSDANALRAPWNRMTSPGRDPWHREFRQYRVRPLMETALADLSGGRPRAAVAALEEFAQDTDDLNVFSYLAWGYYLTKDEERALAVLDDALGRDPKNILNLRVLARIHEGSGRDAEALEVLDRMLAADPNDGQALRKAAFLRERSGNREGAIDAAQRALELDPGQADLWRLKGTSELALGRSEDAAATFRSALGERLAGAEIRLGLARALAELGRWDEAAQALDGVPEEQGAELRRAIERRSL